MNALEKLHRNGIEVDLAAITQIARRRSIREISVFGSALRDDLRDDSDVEPESLTNPIRRQAILASTERLYAA